MNILERLLELSDKEYGEFSAKLTPGVDANLVIGVRVPLARKLAKQLYKEWKKEGSAEVESFLDTLPHRYYDENMLHGLILSEIKDYQECIDRVNAFLPFVDNWAVCDIMSPKCFKRNLGPLLEQIRDWTEDDWAYSKRFGMEMLMTHYLDDGFEASYLEIPASVHSDEYYVQMMQAWFFATALAKQWDSAIVYITARRLDRWVHNKTIQKARESNRITPEQKEYLKGLRIK